MTRTTLATTHLIFVLVVASLATFQAQAADEAMLDNVRQFLEVQANSLGDDTEVTLYPPAAKFPACPSPKPFLPNASRPPLGRISVGVKCGEQGRRTRFLQAEVSVIGTHLETARDIAAGETITHDNVVFRHGDLARLPRQALRESEQAIGRVTMRPLSEGQVLQDYQLRTPRLVNRGEKVILEARGDGFRITRSAEALAPGGRGDKIRVRLGNREVIDAQVIGKRHLIVDN
ncbi:flagellar basal body P-ring formation chaperone FlgA [Halomonas halmophila]|nr:flagellar basal body P-ring formation chaperone FlgA [Halomonas halmophila]